MNSQSFVALALKTLCCTQKELALKLNVSPTQVTKWKKGDYMSPDMETKFREIISIDSTPPKLILWSGSVDNANKWQNLIYKLADYAQDNNETGYTCDILNDDEGTLCEDVINILIDIGVPSPLGFPEEFSINSDDPEDDELEERFYDSIEENAYSSLIMQIFKALTSVYGFYAAYMYNIYWCSDIEFYDTPAAEIDANLISLAASKISIDPKIAPNHQNFRFTTLKSYEKWVAFFKEKAIKEGIPLPAEFMDLVYKSTDELDEEAERESLGFNQNRLHPDIYMNELLVGIRLIHQVLPVIMEKLGIKDEFKSNRSDLTV